MYGRYVKPGFSGDQARIRATPNVAFISNRIAFLFGLFNHTDRGILDIQHRRVPAFGLSVAVAGDTIVVGAFKDGVLGLEFGAAYVYRFIGAEWVEEEKLIASDSHPRDFFGFSVAVSGDTIVVGADGDDDDGPDSGSAYVFGFDGTNWVERQKLTASDAAERDGLGGSVRILGETIVIGATGNSGSAYVFRFDGSDWVEKQKLAAFDAERGDQFGVSVAISGEVIVVGAPGTNDPGAKSGSAYVFRL